MHRPASTQDVGNHSIMKNWHHLDFAICLFLVSNCFTELVKIRVNVASEVCHKETLLDVYLRQVSVAEWLARLTAV